MLVDLAINYYYYYYHIIIFVCIDCAIGINFACDVYLPDLQVLEIWDFGSTARSWQAK